MMPHIENVKPAGVINVGYRSDISPLVLPFNNVVLPAKALIATVAMKKMTFVTCRKTDLLDDMN